MGFSVKWWFQLPSATVSAWDIPWWAKSWPMNQGMALPAAVHALGGRCGGLQFQCAWWLHQGAGFGEDLDDPLESLECWSKPVVNGFGIGMQYHLSKLLLATSRRNHADFI